MCDLNQIANELRAIEAAARDARAVAQGLRDAAQACTHEQAALKMRLEVAAVSLLMLRQSADNTIAALRRLRGMVELEIKHRGNAHGDWQKSLALIDTSLQELVA
jgi:hypothetical protein